MWLHNFAFVEDFFATSTADVFTLFRTEALPTLFSSIKLKLFRTSLRPALAIHMQLGYVSGGCLLWRIC